MATMLQTPAVGVGQGRCMKYKRKFYHADDYLPSSLVHSPCTLGDKVHDPEGNRAEMTSGASSHTDVVPLSSPAVDISKNGKNGSTAEVNNNSKVVVHQRETGNTKDRVDIQDNILNKRAKMTPEYHQGVGLPSIPDGYSSGINMDTPMAPAQPTFLSGLDEHNSSVQDLSSLLGNNLWRSDVSETISNVPTRQTQNTSSVGLNFPSANALGERSQVTRANNYFEPSQIPSPSGSSHLSILTAPTTGHTNQINIQPGQVSTNQSSSISQVIFVPIVTNPTNEKTVQIATPLSAASFGCNNVTSQSAFNVNASSVFSSLASTMAFSGRPEIKNEQEGPGVQISLQVAPPQPNERNETQTRRRIVPDHNLPSLALPQTTHARDAEPDTTISRPQTQQNNRHALASLEMSQSERRHSTSDDSILSDTESTCTTSTVSVNSTSTPESFLGAYSGVKRPTTLFPRPAKGRSLWEIVDIMARRHRDGYYIGWSAEKILELPPDERPNVFPVTPRLKKELVSKSVLTENKKLAFSFLSNEPWGHTFRQYLRNGHFKTLSDAKRDASQLWRENCPEYDGSRAVRMRDNDGNIVMKRTRQQSGSEFEYRQSLRKAKVSSIVDQIWAKRSVIADALQTSTFDALCREMRSELTDYQLPDDETARLADVVAFSLRKELLATNMDKVQ